MKSLRPYQVDKLKQIEDLFHSGNKEVVLAASPSSGKTLITLHLIKKNPNKKFVILPHSQNILKHQWIKEFNDCKIELGTNVIVEIPQAKKKLKGISEIDCLIIDEAHHNVFAKGSKSQVQTLIKELNPKYILYLTGTPSPFIKRNYKNILIIPGMDLIKSNEKYVSDLYIGMLSTKANLIKSDYVGNELKTSKYYKLEDNVETDLDSFLASIHSRITETNLFKNNPTARKLVDWAPTLGQLHKTMIACKSVIQAKKVTEYFKRKNISVISSNNESDLESLNIQKFIDDKSIKVLVVVNRGILGFNMPELVNIVDLTGSTNIDRIYQLYARGMRYHQDYPNKYFFKVSSDELMLINKWYMEAALSLLREDFISKYNGKNLNGCLVPVFRPKKNSDGLCKRCNIIYKECQCKPYDRTKRLTVPIDELFQGTVSANKVLIDIYNKIGQEVNEYAYITFNKIKESLGFQVYNPKGNKIILEEQFFKKGIKPTLDCGKIYSNYRNYKISDFKWFNKMEKLYPFLKETYLDKKKKESYDKMLSLMPKNIKFKEEQEWKGTNYKYIFLHNQLGEFIGRPDRLFLRWKKGQDYHPSNRGKNKMKKIIDLTTNIIYNSLTEYSNELNIDRSHLIECIKVNKLCKGHKLAYYKGEVK